ncbi:MAG TPA: DAK2 domain-containing protein [Acidimicrobiales bacterium]|nr:DAK2 domain-containing protein [Acidimicrobiales bacterium]
METLERLGAEQVRAVVTAYRDALRTHQEAVNRLNVYPVPDGDTGTNMALTVESVVGELDGTDDMASTCKAIAHGSLMGARGNSGVILCQLLRGLSDAWKASDSVGPTEIADSLRRASDAAYRAVMHPVEGTILTVAAAAASGASEAVAAGKELCDVLQTARAAAAEALKRTPEMLAVLKEAGVVDAGGAGFVLLLDALLHVVTGRPLPEAPPVPADSASASVPVSPLPSTRGADATEDGPRYEVMYLLEVADDAIPGFKRAWSDIGDSIVVVGGEGTWNCHIHTDDIGGAVEAGLDVGGRPRRIHVTDLHEQVEEQRWVREGTGPAEADAPSARTAVVAVASGAGVARIFRSLGAARVVAGGQSMNPSTAEILEAVDGVSADEVVVLPNNSNIVPVAEQVGALTAKIVRVVPTRAVAEGMAALLDYDGNEDAAANAKAMGAAAGRVTPGEVTRAVRASSSSAGPIAEGDWLGLSATGIEVVAPSVAEAATALLDCLVSAGHELVTVLEGEDADPADTRAIHDWLEHHRPGVATEVHDGGQPLYPFLFSIE